jgi:predicted nucleic acid-binding protein
VSALLLDAGVWLAARDADDRFHEPAAALVAGGGAGRAAALDLTLYEVANVATVRWRAPDEAALLAELVVRASDDRLVRVDADLLVDAIALAAADGLTLYDAAYVACARSRGWTLVSTDLRDLVRPGLAASPADALSSPQGGP